MLSLMVREYIALKLMHWAVWVMPDDMLEIYHPYLRDASDKYCDMVRRTMG